VDVQWNRAPTQLDAGVEGLTMNKLIYCLAVAVEPGEGQMGNVGFTFFGSVHDP